jgi:hypothetical protein
MVLQDVAAERANIGLEPTRPPCCDDVAAAHGSNRALGFNCSEGAVV